MKINKTDKKYSKFFDNLIKSMKIKGRTFKIIKKTCGERPLLHKHLREVSCDRTGTGHTRVATPPQVATDGRWLVKPGGVFEFEDPESLRPMTINNNQ